MYALIKRCLADEEPAWADLWQLFEHYAAQPVRLLLVRAGFDATEADDVAQDIYLALHENGNKRLQLFRGESQRALVSWLVHLAINFTRDWIENGWRSKKRHRRSLQGIATPVRPAATEAEVKALIESLQAVLSPAEVDQLRDLAGLATPTKKPVSARTARRRRTALEQKVRENLGLSGRRKSRQSRGKRKKSKECGKILAT